MKFTAIAAMTLGAAAALTSQAQAVTVTFDDFTIAQSVYDPTLGVTPPFSQSSSAVPFGFPDSSVGTRTLTVGNTATDTPGTPLQTSMISGFNKLSFNNIDGATGFGEVEYTGVGDIDIGPSGYFLFTIGAFDNFANFTATVKDTFGNVGVYTELLAPGFSPTLYFSQFSGAVDFNTVASVVFRIDTTGLAASVDGSLKKIEIGAVPVPAAGLMLISGLGGLAALRRRKKQA